jgi:uncharacterized protein YjiS (DUF1127 family)
LDGLSISGKSPRNAGVRRKAATVGATCVRWLAQAIEAWRRARRSKASRHEFDRLSQAALRDIGCHEDESNAYRSDACDQAERIRRRVTDLIDRNGPWL